MEKKEMLKKIVQFLSLLVIALASLLIYHYLRDYEIMVGGILGFAVVYYMCRLYYFPLKNNNRYLKLEFPGLLINVFYGLFMCISLYLAFDQLIKVFFWLIKVI
jgi:hypothetical protein